MRPVTVPLLAAAFLLGSLDDAFAGGRGARGFHHHHGGFHTRVFIGATFVAAPLYAYPYYYAPAPVYYAPPPVYVQPEPAPAQQSYWYYCPSARAYYPYVGECPGGWQRVMPQPAG